MNFSAGLQRLMRVNHLWLAFGAGALSTLAMPPVFLWPILFITLPLMVLILDNLCYPSAEQAPRSKDSSNQPLQRRSLWTKAALIGWLFGFGFFIPTLYWIGNSFLVEADKFAWALPFAVTLLPATLALFYGAAFFAAALAWTKGPERIITFAFMLFAADWLRGHCFTGFPWNIFGHSLTGNPALMQSVSLFGIYGLSALACLIFASPACFIRRQEHRYEMQRSPANLALCLASMLLFIGLYVGGQWRLAAAGETKNHENIELIIIQPNVPQQEKVNPERRLKAFERVMKGTENALLSSSPTEQKRLIIWPETAIPFALNQAKPIRDQIARLLNPQDQLITGAYYVQPNSEATTTAPRFKVYNSLYVLNGEGKIKALYNKHHLVPFGEYLPFPNLLNALGFEALVRLRSGFAPGNDAQTVPLEQAPPFLPYICYEAIFPYTPPRGAPPQWLLNISNDGWFGRTAGPYQHEHMVKLRALEAGLPMIRVVNGGISGVYDHLARPLAKTKLGVMSSIKANLPKAMPQPPSILSRTWLALIILMIIFILISTIKFFDKTA